MRVVVVAIVVATARCTSVATFTEKNAFQVSTIIQIASKSVNDAKLITINVNGNVVVVVG